MGLLNPESAAQSAVNSAQTDLRNKFLDPFKAPIGSEEVKSAHARNDFKKGFIIAELLNGKFDETHIDTVILKGDSMPHVPFAYGGTQKLIKDYYPGNSEPTVQVLGPRENDIMIRGRLKAKKLRAPAPTKLKLDVNIGAAVGFFASKIPAVPDVASNAGSEGNQKLERLRRFPEEMQEHIEGMRLRGNLVRITMGGFQRFGFIEEATFNLKTVADIEYEIKFSIVGFNPPQDCKILTGARSVPTARNKKLITEVLAFQALATQIPESMPRSISDQISDAIGVVADTVGLVTGFVDTALSEVDDLKSSAARAVGLVKHARNKMVDFNRRIGNISSFGTVSLQGGGGISAGYANASFLKTTQSSSFSIAGLLAGLGVQLSELRVSEPLARHKVQQGDTLQKIAHKFYQDSSQWKEIYDHNLLTTTELDRADILEIPRIGT